MRKYNNQLYPNNKEMCYQLGLLKDDMEWRKYLEEEEIESSPKHLRQTLQLLSFPTDIVKFSHCYVIL